MESLQKEITINNQEEYKIYYYSSDDFDDYSIFTTDEWKILKKYADGFDHAVAMTSLMSDDQYKNMPSEIHKAVYSLKYSYNPILEDFGEARGCLTTLNGYGIPNYIFQEILEADEPITFNYYRKKLLEETDFIKKNYQIIEKEFGLANRY